jgi:hypothetical protein
LEIAKAQAEKEAEKELNNPSIDMLDVAQEGPVLQPCSDTPKQGKGEKPPKKWGGGGVNKETTPDWSKTANKHGFKVGFPNEIPNLEY